ncbi:MAG: MBL fold metallo-hydrolase [Bacillota bacterium]|nr:MBL fold metallo-hydrolase [Bacillota bacterium]MDW7729848.1 MBL fold metallo-hydrolase [Bacillota bacterium]
MEIKWYGTASLEIKDIGSSIIFDPFFSLNKDLSVPKPDQFSGGSDIFITHGHFDHLMHLQQILAGGQMNVYCSKEAADSLRRDGVDVNRVNIINPGDIIEKGPLKIEVLKGAHIRFDLPLIIKTLFSRRAISHFKELKELIKLAKLYPEGEVLIYKISNGSKSILHLGSLNLDPNETYPADIDLLTLPFQGRSDLDSYAVQFIEKLRPKTLYLHHFDDTFPPVSSPVNIAPFTAKIAKIYPEMSLYIPEYGKPMII